MKEDLRKTIEVLTAILQKENEHRKATKIEKVTGFPPPLPLRPQEEKESPSNPPEEVRDDDSMQEDEAMGVLTCQKTKIGPGNVPQIVTTATLPRQDAPHGCHNSICKETSETGHQQKGGHKGGSGGLMTKICPLSSKQILRSICCELSREFGAVRSLDNLSQELNQDQVFVDGRKCPQACKSYWHCSHSNISANACVPQLPHRNSRPQRCGPLARAEDPRA